MPLLQKEDLKNKMNVCHCGGESDVCLCYDDNCVQRCSLDGNASD